MTQSSTAAVGHSLRSETKDVNQHAIEIDDDRDVILIDSPGFNDTCESRQKQLQEDFLKESLDRGAKLERHNNTPESACTLIARFLRRPPVALRIQTELCEQKKDLLQTSAGLVIKSDLELQREKRKGAKDKVGVAQLNNKQSEWENDSTARRFTMRAKTEKVDELLQKDPENSRSTLVELGRMALFSLPVQSHYLYLCSSRWPVQQ